VRATPNLSALIGVLDSVADAKLEISRFRVRRATELQIREFSHYEFRGCVHNAPVDHVPSDALTVPAGQPDVKVQAIGTERTCERDDLRRLIKGFEAFRLARGAGHPDARSGKTANTRNYVAGTKSVLIHNTPELLLEIRPGHKSERHYLHQATS
jgi:hypothetical protein